MEKSDETDAKKPKLDPMSWVHTLFAYLSLIAWLYLNKKHKEDCSVFVFNSLVAIMTTA